MIKEWKRRKRYYHWRGLCQWTSGQVRFHEFSLRYGNTGNIFLQLVSQHCCTASWNPLLRVLPRLRPTCFAAKYSVASLHNFRRIIGQSCVIFRDSEVLSVWSSVSFQIARRKVVFLWQFFQPFWLFAAACFERTRCSKDYDSPRGLCRGRIYDFNFWELEISKS